MTRLDSELKEIFSIVLSAYEVQKNSKDERTRDYAFTNYLDNCLSITKTQIVNTKNKIKNEARTQRLSGGAHR
jgi:hypothetical protein